MKYEDTNAQPLKLRTLSIGSIILGLLGAVFYWWVPLGMVISITGMTFSFVDWACARRRSLDYRLAIVGLLVSAAALAFCIVIAWLGLQSVTFQSLR
jgi:hypothetical protein